MAALIPGPNDIRFSVRRLRKSPGFALTAIFTLALGIGAVASVFSVVNAVLLKPFAYRDPGRLVVMRESVEEMHAQFPALPFNYLHYLRLKKDSKTIEDATIFQTHGVSVSASGDHPHIIGAVAVSPNFFSVLGVQPILGRDFTPEEEVKGHDKVVVLSWNGWQELFNGAAALLLALLGVYGVLAYSVSLRRQELGIRIALGSNKSQLTGLVLRQAAFPVLTGSAAGIALAFVASRWVRSLLYQTQPIDPVAIAGSLALLIATAILAAVLPARRASRVEPIEVLRNE